MSGGPAITDDGGLVGVNVQTAGNQVSFLVPGSYVQALVDRLSPGKAEPVSFMEEIERQLFENQDDYMKRFLDSQFTEVELSDYLAPGKGFDAFKCWSDIEKKEEQPYTLVRYSCMTQDSLYLTGDYSTGEIFFTHRLFSSDTLTRFQFANLVQSVFEMSWSGVGGIEEHYTNFRCETRFVDVDSLDAEAVFCIRGHKLFAGLYDAVLRIVPLNQDNESLITQLRLTGVSWPNLKAAVAKYFSGIKWQTS